MPSSLAAMWSIDVLTLGYAYAMVFPTIQTMGRILESDRKPYSESLTFTFPELRKEESYRTQVGFRWAIRGIVQQSVVRGLQIGNEVSSGFDKNGLNPVRFRPNSSRCSSLSLALSA